LEDRDERPEAYTIDPVTEGNDVSDVGELGLGGEIAEGDVAGTRAIAGEGDSATEASAPPSRRSPHMRARIEGIEAGVAAGLVPAPPVAGAPDQADEDHLPADTFAPASEAAPLPDWRDPPTREIPRVLLEHPLADRTPTVPGPVWREVESDWAHDDLTFADLVNEGTSVAEHTLSPDEPDPFAFDFVVDPASSGSTTAGSFHPTAGVNEFDAGYDDRAGENAAAWAGENDEGDPWEETEAGRSSADGGGRSGLATTEPSARDRGKPAHRVKVTFAGRKRQTTSGNDSETAPAPASGAPGTADAVGAPATQSGGKRDPIIATVTGLGVGVVALLCFLAGPPLALALVSLVLIVSIAECYQALRRARYRPAVLLGLLGVPALAIGAYLKGPQAFPVVGAFFVMATMGWYLLGLTRKSRIANLSATVMGWAWIGMGGFAGLLLDPTLFGHRHGVAYLLGAIEATVAYDVGGYAFGSWIGKHRLAPAISPNKTWEGLFGGCFAAIAVAIGVTSQMAPWTIAHAAELGVVVAVFAPLGDLAESMIKRELGVKDMGSVLPAHGGLLDRIDALLFVLPATYCLIRLFHG
jgi:phosphatidate cytidylyltransferase